jgi:hypothetical protein
MRDFWCWVSEARAKLAAQRHRLGIKIVWAAVAQVALLASTNDHLRQHEPGRRRISPRVGSDIQVRRRREESMAWCGFCSRR